MRTREPVKPYTFTYEDNEYRAYVKFRFIYDACYGADADGRRYTQRWELDDYEIVEWVCNDDFIKEGLVPDPVIKNIEEQAEEDDEWEGVLD